MLDHWLDQGHLHCGSECTSPLHETWRAYMALPSSKEPLSGLEETLVRMFEIRVDLEFAVDDIFGVSTNAYDEDHYLAKSDLQHIALALHQFSQLHGRLEGLLGPGQRELVSHLGPIYGRIEELVGGVPDMREPVVNPGSGLFGAITMPNGARSEPAETPDNSYLVCAILVNMFVDGLVNSMPGVFLAAFAKLPSNYESIRMDDLESFREQVSSFTRQNPIHCLDFAAMGSSSALLASELVRLNWGLSSSVNAYCFRNKLQSFPSTMSRLQKRFEYRMMELYLKHVVTELRIFVDVYERMARASPVPLADDNAIREVMASRDEIVRLRDLVAHGSAVGEYEPFAVALEGGIGHDRLLFLAGIAAEWIGINSNHFQEKCEYGALLPDLPDVGRYLYLMFAEREAEEYRLKAHSALAEKSAIPAMVQ